jgi:hypothetical protein
VKLIILLLGAFSLALANGVKAAERVRATFQIAVLYHWARVNDPKEAERVTQGAYLEQTIQQALTHAANAVVWATLAWRVWTPGVVGRWVVVVSGVSALGSLVGVLVLVPDVQRLWRTQRIVTELDAGLGRKDWLEYVWTMLTVLLAIAMYAATIIAAAYLVFVSRLVGAP